jgi:hypothetical protein
MDPITLIVAALAGGAALGLKWVAPEVRLGLLCGLR